MRNEYDFSKATKKALIPSKGKTRISIFIDNAVLDEFRTRAEAAGTGYQTMMNEALRQYLSSQERPITESKLREVLREVLPVSAAPPDSRSSRSTRKRATG